MKTSEDYAREAAEDYRMNRKGHPISLVAAITEAINLALSDTTSTHAAELAKKDEEIDKAKKDAARWRHLWHEDKTLKDRYSNELATVRAQLDREAQGRENLFVDAIRMRHEIADLRERLEEKTKEREAFIADCQRNDISAAERIDLPRLFRWQSESLESFRDKFGATSNLQALDGIDELRTQLAEATALLREMDTDFQAAAKTAKSSGDVVLNAAEAMRLIADIWTKLREHLPEQTEVATPPKTDSVSPLPEPPESR